MKKKVTSLLLAFVMILGMMVTAVPALAAAAPDTLIITTDETEVYPGDEITYTVAIGPVKNLAGIWFKLNAPDGLSFKEGNLVDGLKDKLSKDKLSVNNCQFNTDNQVVAIVGGMDYTSEENTDILTVTYTVDADFIGKLTLGVDSDVFEFFDVNNNIINMTVLNSGSEVNVVERPVLATSITLNKETLSLKNGESEKLVATLTPAENDDSVTWKSSNTAVAIVSADGTVTAVAKGSAVITAKSANVSATCTITVACAHKNTKVNAAVASTCILQGHGAYTVCNDCGELISGSDAKLPVDKTNHVNTSKYDAVDATCLTPGHAEYVKCNDCMVILSGSDAEIKGAHASYINRLDAKYLKSAADCENAAVYYKSCELCGAASETETFRSGNALGHDYSADWSSGDTGHWHECSVCGDKKDLEKHTYKDGFCNACGYKDNHVHKLTLVAAVAATCTKDGSKAYYACSTCDDIFENAEGTVKIKDKASLKIAALGHKFAAATCTTAKTCTVCNATEGEALGHKFADATCTTAKTCTVCNATEGEALGHKFAAATCTTAKTCTVCNVTEGEALGHKFADATCTTAKTCTVCKVTEGEALGHKFADATCTAAKTCTVCNVTEGEALGHSFGEWVTVKVATFTEEGLAERVCATCSEKESKAIEKLAYLLGDANLDGQITAADARIILRISAKLETLEDNKIAVENIDVNFDGTVSASDARTVLRVAAKLESMPEKAN